MLISSLFSRQRRWKFSWNVSMFYMTLWKKTSKSTNKRESWAKIHQNTGKNIHESQEHWQFITFSLWPSNWTPSMLLFFVLSWIYAPAGVRFWIKCLYPKNHARGVGDGHSLWRIENIPWWNSFIVNTWPPALDFFTASPRNPLNTPILKAQAQNKQPRTFTILSSPVPSKPKI